MISAREGLERLREGNRRFAAGDLGGDTMTIRSHRELAEGVTLAGGEPQDE